LPVKDQLADISGTFASFLAYFFVIIVKDATITLKTLSEILLFIPQFFLAKELPDIPIIVSVLKNISCRTLAA